jgi:hypothetical protein
MKRIRYNFCLIIPLFIIWLIIVVPVSSAVVPAGTPDPDFYVSIYKPDKVWPGTTLFADYHNPAEPRIVEVNMQGEVVWEYVLPANLIQYTNPGFDVELLPDNNILFLLPRNGVYEVDRKGNVVWSYPDSKVSHDADRLQNGNTLINFGGGDQKDDAQVKEVNPEGKIIWSWHAKDVFNKEPYLSIQYEGWTHSNAVTRLPDGNTLVSLRNFNLTVEVNPQGAVVWQYDWSSIGGYPHDPMMLPNGNILVSFPSIPDKAVEINPKTNEIVWQYIIKRDQSRNGSNRDADRLQNGNTLINDGTKLIEVTPAKEIVWQFNIKGLEQASVKESLNQYLFKSERIGMQAPRFSVTYPGDGGCTPGKTDISIQYTDIDLGSIWYRVFDRTKNMWATENITYVRNKWANAITFTGKEAGQQTISLEEGNYTLYVWAASTGWGDENLYTPKVINTAESKVNFSVTAGCAVTKPPAAQEPSPAGSPTETHTSAAPLPPFIAFSGIGIAGLLAILCKKEVR